MMRVHTKRLAIFLLAIGVATTHAQKPAAKAYSGRVVLVLPFENRSGDATLDWVGQAFPMMMDERLASAGYMPLTRDDRVYAMDHLGLPENFKPTHATALRIAQTLGADYVVFGSYKSANSRFSADAEVLDVKALRLLPGVEDSTATPRLIDLQNAIAWKLATELNPQLHVAEETFVAAAANLPVSAFEMYVRGVVATQNDESIADLSKAVQMAPDFAPASLALGKVYFAAERYSEAAVALQKVPKNDSKALEAGFYAGLAQLYTGHYGQAEQAFEFVAERLPLPEVINNEGVAQSRAGKNGAGFYTRAMESDPGNEDYVYNLAVTLRRNGDLAGSLTQTNAALNLKPHDKDATQLKLALQSVPSSATSGQVSAEQAAMENFQPIERIERTWQEASYRQAAFELDEVRSMRLAALPAAEQSAERVRQGEEYLGQGQTLEAEHEFRAALEADPSGPSAAQAHAGIAAVRAQSGSMQEARNEAQASLALKENVNALLVLARLDLGVNDLNACVNDVHRALAIEPKNAAVLGMVQALQSRGRSVQ